MIFTSYFAWIDQLRAAGIVPIAISRSVPKFARGMAWFPQLAPKADILDRYRADHDEAAYIREYIPRVLGRLNVADVARQLSEISGGGDVALCCYEKPGAFCHRHLVADWLDANGFQCAEWEPQGSFVTMRQETLWA